MRKIEESKEEQRSQKERDNMHEPSVTPAQEKVQQLATAPNQVLYKLSTVFPFDLFPTTIVVEKTQVHLVNSLFFMSNQLESVLIENIAIVEVSTSVFFARLKITTVVPLTPVIDVNFLRKNEALKAREIIQGLMVAVAKKINIAEIPSSALGQTASSLGATKVE